MKGVDISPSKDGGLLKEILKEGNGDEKPVHRDRVCIHYVAKLPDGTQIDSSRDRKQKVVFEIGKSSVIKGWELAVVTMKRGEICRLTCQPEYAYGEQGMSELIQPNQTILFEMELVDFIGEDLSEEKDESILKRTLTSGEGGLKPKDGSEVEISLKAVYENRVFDERVIKFIIGEGILYDIPQSLECALTHMTKNEYVQVTLKSKATNGLDKFKIPKNTRVDYFVTLMNFKKGINKWALSDVDKLFECTSIKKRAAEFVKDGHYAVACRKYKMILDYLQSAEFDRPDQKLEANELIFTSHSNMALCHWKLNEFAACIRDCDKALELNPNHEKCLYRRGQSQMSMCSYEEAIEDFQTVLKLNPNNKEAKQSIEICRDHLKTYQKQEKQLYTKIFTMMAKTNK